MSDESYYVEQRSRPAYRPPFKGKPFDPNRRTQPLWTSREQLARVLAQYRKWYDEGLSDRQISYCIQKMR